MEKIVYNCNGCNRNCSRDSEGTKRVIFETSWQKLELPEDFFNCPTLRKMDRNIITLLTN